MSEHWKSTPKYWCKHCACYVRDTKLERQNHESTAKHQGALKRFLRELHRGHEQEEREKDRARQEIARLNGVVSGSSSSGPSSTSYKPAQSVQPAAPPEAQLKKQREQLAAMGVAVPTDFRPEMAMAGEWTVTNTRVIEPQSEVKTEAKASGVRKREETEEEKEEEDAVRSLFKKPRRWGRDSKAAPAEDDAELDALLSGSIARRRSVDEGTDVKAETSSDPVKTEAQEEPGAVKEEPDDSTKGLAEAVKAEDTAAEPSVKAEDADAPGDTGPAPVVFKKRKAKGIRQK